VRPGLSRAAGSGRLPSAAVLHGVGQPAGLGAWDQGQLQLQ